MDPLLPINAHRKFRAEGIAQMVEHLPSKCRTPVLLPSQKKENSTQQMPWVI
jgi:hypothetical protein